MSDPNGGRRLPLAEAETLATEVAALLRPACLRWEIAGSLRRRRPTIGDLEVVAVPRTRAEGIDLFGAAHGTVDELDARCRELQAAGAFLPRLDRNGRQALGPRYRRLLYRGVGLDLFSPDLESWGLILLIRTGCAAWSRRFVTPHLMGGWLPTGMRVEGGRLWDGGAPLPTRTEEQVFVTCGLPWIDPEARTETVRLVRRPSGLGWMDGGAVG